MTGDAANDPSANPFAHGTDPAHLEQLRREGCTVSGPAYPFDEFKAGWAHAAFPRTAKAHYYRELPTDEIPYIGKHGRVRFYESLCHHDAYAQQVAGMFQTGNWPRCAKCQKVVDRKGLK